MRLLSVCFIAAVLLIKETAGQTETDQSDKSLFEIIQTNENSQIAHHHLEIPALAPIKQLLSGSSADQQYTIFLPTNDAISSCLQGVFETFCEQRYNASADGEPTLTVRRKPFKRYGKRVGMPKMTNEDCQNLGKMLSLDQKLMQNVRKTRRFAYRVQRLDLSDQYQQLQFSPGMEKFFLATVAYHIVPQLVSADEIQANTDKSFPTLASSTSLELGKFVTPTKFVLHKGNEGGLRAIYASPMAPVCCADVVGNTIKGNNGLLYFINQAKPVPYPISSSLIYNKLLITHALLNYTGLLNRLDQSQNVTLFAPSDEAWLNAIPELLRNSKFKQIIGSTIQRYNRMLRLPITRVLMAREAKHRTIHDRSQVHHETVSLTDVFATPIREDSGERTETTLDQSTVRQILLHHVADGVYFSDDLQSTNNIDALSGQQLTVGAQSVSGEMGAQSLMVGNAQVLYPDIPVFNGALHVIDRVIQNQQ